MKQRTALMAIIAALACTLALGCSNGSTAVDPVPVEKSVQVSYDAGLLHLLFE